jgi:hypothetical protein
MRTTLVDIVERIESFLKQTLSDGDIIAMSRTGRVH